MKRIFPDLLITSALLSTVSSLNCTFCNVLSFPQIDTADVFSKRTHCQGKVLPCPSDEDVCGSIFTFFITNDASFQAIFWRTCWKPQACNRSESASTPGVQISYSVTCCTTDDCTPLRPELKAENATKNGVLCPACISNHEPCTANYSMACTGEERYCLTLQGKFIGSKPIMHTSGCSTFAESLCRENQPLDFLTYPDEKIPTRYTKVTSKTNLATRHFIWCRICHNCPEEYNPKAKAILCSQDEDVCVYERTRIIYVPSISNGVNGLVCPACYYPNSDRCLRYNNLQCTGDEKRCVHYTRTENQGRYIVMETLHGCTTDEICEAGSILTEADDERNTFSTIKTDIRCTVSGAITWSSAIYKFLMITYTALCVLDI